MNLLQAHGQWATRPADETFWGIGDALEAARLMKSSSATAIVPYDALRVEAVDGDLCLVGRTGVPAFPTYSAAGQLCARAKVPHSFVARQPATLAAQNINWGLKEYRGPTTDQNGNPIEDKAVLMFHRNGRLVLRALTSEIYERLWHADLLERMANSLSLEWRTPPARPSSARNNDPRIRPATAEDVGNTGGILACNVGDLIGPAGVYMSDKDLFVFVWNTATVEGPSGPLHKFAIITNNEIGTGSWGVICGLADAVCGNHIIWGARNVTEVRCRHVGEGTAIEGMSKAALLLDSWSGEGSRELEAAVRLAGQTEIGKDKNEVVENVVAYARQKNIPELSERRIGKAYDRAEEAGRYGSPRTPWGVASGLTELSQESHYADERVNLDRAAGKILSMVF